MVLAPPERARRRGAPAAGRPGRRTAEAAGERPSPATERLSRLLAMVPYLLAPPGHPAAPRPPRQFGISEDQLVKDLELLFVCGTPGHMPDDLIEAEWDDGHVYLNNADAIARPLRLGVDEALALLVGLRALADVPGLHDRDALDRTLRQARGRRGGRRRGERAGRRRGGGRGARSLATAGGRSPATAGCTCATSSPPATRPPSATSTRCGCCSSTGAGTSRAGATAPRTVRLFRLDRVEA